MDTNPEKKQGKKTDKPRNFQNFITGNCLSGNMFNGVV